MGDLGFEIFIICECIAIAQSSSVLSALLCLVSAYFSFNIEYLPTFKNVLVFLQRVILEIEMNYKCQTLYFKYVVYWISSSS